MSLESAERIRTDLLLYGAKDFLDLPWTISAVARVLEMDPQEEPEIVPPTIAAIQDLLEAGLAVAGDGVEDKDGFFDVRPWNVPPSEAVKLIEVRWNEISDRPKSGDVAWLALTDAGSEAARDLKRANERKQ